MLAEHRDLLKHVAGWFSFAKPVAKRWCQNSAIFSSSGFLVLIIRYSQYDWAGRSGGTP